MKEQRSFYLFRGQSFAVSTLVPLLIIAVSGYGASETNRSGWSNGAKGVVNGGLGGAALGALIGVAAGDTRERVPLSAPRVVLSSVVSWGTPGIDGCVKKRDNRHGWPRNEHTSRRSWRFAMGSTWNQR